MSLNETALNPLEGISGFAAAYVYLGSGETLISKTNQDMKDANIGGLAVELYRAAKIISDRMGLGIANFVEVHTEHYIFIHTCIIPGVAAMAVIVSKDGNLGLIKHEMVKIAKSLEPEFKES